MKFLRPRSLNRLLLVGFGLVALPLLFAVVWALVSLDRVAVQSEELISSGARAAEQNQRLTEQIVSLERVARQYRVLGSPDILQIMQQDHLAFQDLIADMAPLVERAGAATLATTLRR